MHSSSLEPGSNSKAGGDLLVAIAALVTEGRIPVLKSGSKSKGFYEGPHCGLTSPNSQHDCDPTDFLCQKYNKIRTQVQTLWEKGIPLCVEVLLTTDCSCKKTDIESDLDGVDVRADTLLEQWYFHANPLRSNEPIGFKLPQLIYAIRSQLHFSQISAWLSAQENQPVKLSNQNLRYSLTIPGETYETSKFSSAPNTHHFPKTDLGNGFTLTLSLLSLPRLTGIPLNKCPGCKSLTTKAAEKTPTKPAVEKFSEGKNLNDSGYEVLDDRMHTSCTRQGKHRCDEVDDFDSCLKKGFGKTKRVCHANECGASDATFKHPNEAGCYKYGQGKHPNDKQLNEASSYKHSNESGSSKCDGFKPDGKQLTCRGPNFKYGTDAGVKRSTDSGCRFTNDAGCKHTNDVYALPSFNSNLHQHCEPSTSAEFSREELMRKANENLEKYVPNEKRGLKTEDKKVKTPKLDLELSREEINEVMSVLNHANQVRREISAPVVETKVKESSGDILLNAILRSCLGGQDVAPGGEEGAHRNEGPSCDSKCVHKLACDKKGPSLQNGCGARGKSDSDTSKCDKRSEKSDIFNIRRSNLVDIFVDNSNNCDSSHIPNKNAGPGQNHKNKMQDISNFDFHAALAKPVPTAFKGKVRQKLSFDEKGLVNKLDKKLGDINYAPNFSHVEANKVSTSINKVAEGNDNDISNNTNKKECGRGDGKKVKSKSPEVPSAIEQERFRKSLDNATCKVFNSKTGLPLTSSPAPIRRGKAAFDFDSSINSVSAIKSALFSASFSTDDDSESDGSIVSPCSPEITVPAKEPPLPTIRRRGHSGSLLGSFEESVLNGRLEPVSTVQGFRAELGASGSFVPRHLFCPVTVFFYSLGDSDKVSSPYLGHINLSKKGYNVPTAGTVQVTLFNPLGTVVKMFVIVYDLSDMPPNAVTFIRQRTFYVPTDSKDDASTWGPQWLRYLIHLRFMSSKSGRIYLHSDIRMIIFRQSDLDTATAHGREMSYELRSVSQMPSEPKYSLKKGTVIEDSVDE